MQVHTKRWTERVLSYVSKCFKKNLHVGYIHKQKQIQFKNYSNVRKENKI